MVPGLRRVQGFEDENRFAGGHFVDVDGFINAGYGKEVDVGFAEDIYNFGDTVSVGIGLDYCAELCSFAAQAFLDWQRYPESPRSKYAPPGPDV